MGVMILVLLGIIVFLIAKQVEFKKANTILANEKSKLQDEVDKNKSSFLEYLEKYKQLKSIIDNIRNWENKVKDNKNTCDSLNNEIANLTQMRDQISTELSKLQKEYSVIEFGIYENQYDFESAEKYKLKLNSIKEEQKILTKEGKVVISPKIELFDPKSEASKVLTMISKLILRTFNIEFENLLNKVKFNNIVSIEDKVYKLYETINKQISDYQISISKTYFDLKLSELKLVYEYQEKLEEEREEQRRIKEQIREEEKARKEAEKAEKQADEDASKYELMLKKAFEEQRKATGTELSELNDEIAKLQAQLQEALTQKERAKSMAQLTRSGHVYIISNIGSFGENIYKIGMTRRLEPLDRVKELGDASVPFEFDVHALIPSDNAPSLENQLHAVFSNKRVNMVNDRKEFFNVSINEIEKVVKDAGYDFQFTKLASAKEYRETIQLKANQMN